MSNKSLLIAELEDRETLAKDKNNLRQFQIDIKKANDNYYDELMLKFLQEEDFDIKDFDLIKRIFKFLKEQN